MDSFIICGNLSCWYGSRCDMYTIDHLASILLRSLIWTNLFNSPFHVIFLAFLAGKICLVTGASRGIGKGIALQLGEAGATVYITGILLLLDTDIQYMLDWNWYKYMIACYVTNKLVYQ